MNNKRANQIAAALLEDNYEQDYEKGLACSKKDKAAKRSRDVSRYSKAFQDGYWKGRNNWWDRANSKITNWASTFGRSYGKH